MRELRALVCAFSFLTRLPVPASTHTPDASTLRRATAYFPLVGALVGSFTACAAWMFARVFPLELAVLLALALEARLTGAFHEDAVADSFDAFGGGFTRSRVLEILKDSRLGTYGVLALAFAILIRAGATSALEPQLFFAAVIAAASFGRACGMLVLARLPPIVDRAGLSKDVGGIGRREVAIGCVFALAALAWPASHAPGRTAIGVVLGLAVVAWTVRYARRRIGGSTGDVLGAATYAAQIAVLLALAARR